MNPVIKATNISKIFKLYDKQSDRLKDTFLPFRKKTYFTPFHALNDITFEVNKGETFGIVGRNGSGKSTLLQIICRILQESSGNIKVNGRISALLELGAGFNPEFSGRENVYLKASVLGMGRKEIDLYMDQILEFADIGKFIDQPVKTYSSGMYVRLAFAVAINVHPDILIVDEALSVGDTLFQAKCFAKFKEFQEQGVTILFVTHSMGLITKYCDRAILLDKGNLLMQGVAKDVVDEYNRLIVDCSKKNKIEVPTPAITKVKNANISINNNDTLEQTIQSFEGRSLTVSINPNENRYGNGKAEIVNFGVKVLTGKASQTFVHGELYQFWVKVKIHKVIIDPIVAFTIKDVKGFIITGSNTLYKDKVTGEMSIGDNLLVSFKQVMSLNPGRYLLSIGCAGYEDGNYVVYDRRFDICPIQVVSTTQSVGLYDMNSEVDVYHFPKA